MLVCFPRWLDPQSSETPQTQVSTLNFPRAHAITAESRTRSYRGNAAQQNKCILAASTSEPFATLGATCYYILIKRYQSEADYSKTGNLNANFSPKWNWPV